jgi:hypothetical protein
MTILVTNYLRILCLYALAVIRYSKEVPGTIIINKLFSERSAQNFIQLTDYLYNKLFFQRTAQTTN